MDSKTKQKVVFKPKAIKSINSIAEHIAAEGYPERSKKFAARLYEFGLSLSLFSEKYKLCPHPKLTLRSLRCAVFEKNYIFIYKLVNEELIVFNIIHARTNPKSFAA